MDSVTPGGPFDIIVFGGNGDLTLRKLLPALYYRDRDGQLPDGARIIAVARTEMGREGYLDRVDKACREQLAGGDFDAVAWDKFRKRLDYVAADASDVDSISALAQQVSDDDQRGRIFYLATAPALFGPACQALQAAKLVTATSRVVLEKPIGHDLASSRKINDEVGAVFPEDRTFRIDHYLGKETVQNLLVLRFANALFERLWHCGEIDHVQITVAETIGVEGRGDYYDRAGALRDMVQNHLLQLLCLIAIEPPVSLDPDVVRDEKLKVLKAVRPISGAEVEAKTVRGQYRAGAVDGVPVPGYLDEIDGDDSATETFVALKVEVDNWRWAGVPFYLRSGKRLPTRFSEIVIQFRPVPHLIFPAVSGSVVANRLVYSAATKRGHHAADDGQGARARRHAPLPRIPRSVLCGYLQAASPRRL